jgi:7,8-dihydroneopterin aldolase/epimerase/oxygenase
MNSYFDTNNKPNPNSPLGVGGSFIFLENMEFHAFHGCLDFEQQLGNTFVVSLSMVLNTDQAGKTDNLEDTLNYQLVYDTVKEQMEIQSKLIEHVTQRILDSVFEKFPQITELNIKLSKLNPPLGGKVERVTIQLERKR